MDITFHGAAKSVTGSRHELRFRETRILLDCGLFQGRRQESNRLNRHLGLTPNQYKRFSFRMPLSTIPAHSLLCLKVNSLERSI